MKYIFIFLILFASSPSHAWEITRSYFKVESVFDLSNGNYKKMDQASLANEEDSYWSAVFTLHSEFEVRGKIVIDEYDRATISKRKTVIDNVYILMDSYGINLRAGLVQDTYFPLRGLHGKRITDLFDHTFYGGKIAAGLALIIGIEPNYSFLTNSTGIRIPNIEQIFTISPVNLNLEIGYITMKFNTTSTTASSKNVYRSGSGLSVNTNNTKQQLSIDEIKNIVIGE